MKTILFSEIKRIINNRTVLLYLITGLLFNFLCIMLSTGYQAVSPEGYKKLASELVAMDDSEVLEYLEGETEKLHKLFIYGEAPEGYPRYTADVYSDYLLCEEVYGELRQVACYDEYLDEIENKYTTTSDLGNILGLSEYDWRYLEGLHHDYMSMRDVRPKYVFGKGWMLAVRNYPSYIVMVVLSMIILMVLFLKDNETEKYRLFDTMVYGRKKLMIGRMLALAASVAVITLVVFAESILLYCGMYGYGASTIMTAPVQSLPGANSCILHISVGEFLALVYTGTVLAVYAICQIVLLVSRWSRNITTLFFISAVFGAASLAMYLLIDSGSRYAVLKWVNLFAMLIMPERITEYKMIDLFGYPVLYIAVVVAFIGVALAGLFIANALLRYGSAGGVRKKRGIGIHLPYMGHELYKLMIKDRAWLAIALLVLFSVSNVEKIENTYLDVREIYYIKYISELDGEFNSDKEAYIREQKELLFEELNAYGAGISEAARLDMDYKLYALEKCEAYAGYLRGQNGASFVDSRGSELVIKRSQSNYLAMLMGITIIIMGVTAYCVRDSATNMKSLSYVSLMGRRRTDRRQHILTILFALIVFAGIYIPQLARINSEFGINGMLYQANSIQAMDGVPSIISIGVMLIFTMVVRLVCMLGCMELVRAFSKKATSAIEVMVKTELVCVLAVTLLYKM